jgi:hypothetical protein
MKGSIKNRLMSCFLATTMSVGVAGVAKAQNFSDLPNPVVQLSATPGAQQTFITGLNLGWLYEYYGFDFGPNVVGDRATYNGPKYAEVDPTTAANLLRDTNGKVTRIFAFEGAEGLTFSSSGYVNGVAPSFITNLEDFLGKLRARGMSAMIMLMTPNEDEGSNGLPRIGGGAISTGGTVVDYYRDATARTALINNGIGTLVDRLHNDGYDNAIFAYEVLNEYNIGGDSKLWVPNGTSGDNYTAIYNFTQAASQRIKQSWPGYVTTSTTNYVDQNVKNYGIDFLDVHIYNTDNSAPSLAGVTFPVIAGEMGNLNQNSDSTQNTALDAMLRNVVRAGYAGVMPWWLGSSKTGGDVYSFLVRNGSGPSSTSTRPAYATLQNFNQNMLSRGSTGTDSLTSVTFPSSINPTGTVAVPVQYTTSTNRVLGGYIWDAGYATFRGKQLQNVSGSGSTTLNIPITGSIATGTAIMRVRIEDTAGTEITFREKTDVTVGSSSPPPSSCPTPAADTISSVSYPSSVTRTGSAAVTFTYNTSTTGRQFWGYMWSAGFATFLGKVNVTPSARCGTITITIPNQAGTNTTSSALLRVNMTTSSETTVIVQGPITSVPVQ